MGLRSLSDWWRLVVRRGHDRGVVDHVYPAPLTPDEQRALDRQQASSGSRRLPESR